MKKKAIGILIAAAVLLGLGAYIGSLYLVRACFSDLASIEINSNINVNDEGYEANDLTGLADIVHRVKANRCPRGVTNYAVDDVIYEIAFMYKNRGYVVLLGEESFYYEPGKGGEHAFRISNGEELLAAMDEYMATHDVTPLAGPAMPENITIDDDVLAAYVTQPCSWDFDEAGASMLSLQTSGLTAGDIITELVYTVKNNRDGDTVSFGAGDDAKVLVWYKEAWYETIYIPRDCTAEQFTLEPGETMSQTLHMDRGTQVKPLAEGIYRLAKAIQCSRDGGILIAYTDFAVGPETDDNVTGGEGVSGEELKQALQAGYIGVCGVNLKEETFAVYPMKEAEKEIRLPSLSQELSVDTLPVYQEATDETGKIPGTAYDCFEKSLPGITKRALDHNYLMELLETDPSLKAACEYAGITDPELYFCHSYNLYAVPSAEYEIIQMADSAEARAESLLLHRVYLSIGEEDTITVTVSIPEQVQCVGEYPVRSYEKAVGAFCEKYGLSEDDILLTGFRYLQAERSHTYVIPYYELLIANPEEPVGEELDPAVFTCYELVLLPAIEVE